MLNIMTNNPIVTIINNVKLNHPITMALDPTPASTDPFPKSCAIILAATDAVCCHSTLTSTKIDAMKIIASATWLTGLEGKGLTSLSEPSESSSSCQPGKVASKRRQMKAKMMAMILPPIRQHTQTKQGKKEREKEKKLTRDREKQSYP